MQAACTHGFKLRGIRLHREELDLLSGHCLHVLQEAIPDFRVNGRVFDGRVREDQCARINPILRIGGRIGDHVAICILETGIERCGRVDHCHRGECGNGKKSSVKRASHDQNTSWDDGSFRGASSGAGLQVDDSSNGNEFHVPRGFARVVGAADAGSSGQGCLG